MSTIVTRTVLGSMLQTALFSNRPFNLLANTTLNEKLNIQSGVAPAGGTMPTLKIACIGIGGHAFETGADSIPITKTIKHDPTDFALYKQIPWIMRPAGSDLSQIERAKYALRKTVTYNTNNYIAYYGRRMDTITPAMSTLIETIVNGVSTFSTFTPSIANLNPTPIDFTEDGNNELNGQFINVSLPVSLDITAQEVTEILNACMIIYGSIDYATVSELAICSAVDKTITIEGGASFSEVVACQIAAHVGVHYPLPYANGGVPNTYNLGSSEPLLRVVA